MNYVVPIIIVIVFVWGLAKKVNVYNAFIGGAKGAVPLAASLFPFLFAVFLMMNALSQSGVGSAIVTFIAPPFNLLGIPTELLRLMLIRPFSGSGSLAVLSDVLKQYGADSYVGRAASVIMGSSETVFYVAAVYFAQTKVKNVGIAVAIALFCNLVGGIAACLLCKVM